jgi:hypothetical protein
MHKEDEELLTRIQREQDKHGLELNAKIDEQAFHKVVKQLIDEPPASKQKKKRKRTRHK